jgi:hypothetical protein
MKRQSLCQVADLHFLNLPSALGEKVRNITKNAANFSPPVGGYSRCRRADAEEQGILPAVEAAQILRTPL